MTTYTIPVAVSVTLSGTEEDAARAVVAALAGARIVGPLPCETGEIECWWTPNQPTADGSDDEGHRLIWNKQPREGLSTGEWMILRLVEDRIKDYDLDLTLPTIEEIDAAIDGSMEGTALGEYIGAAWEAAAEIIHDMLPRFRDPDLREEEEEA